MNTTVDRSPNNLERALWMVTPVLTGAVIMILELAAFRLYAPYFGYSIYVWGSMISVVLMALAAGYAIGGRIADRSQTGFPLYSILTASGIYQLLAVYTSHWLLTRLARYGDFSGASLASLIIFAPPMLALATAGPFIIRLIARTGRIGTTAGKIYAISTAGSIAGCMATSFLLVPRVGTHSTLLIACLLSTAVGLSGLLSARPAFLPAMALLGLIHLPPLSPWSKGAEWQSESPYNLVRVLRDNGARLLVLNDDRSAHTIQLEGTPWTGHYYDDFALGPILTDARRALVLGMGAGGSIATMRATSPDLEIDAVEIDDAVVEAATRFFGVKPDAARLRIHVADARPWLSRDTGSYDLVQVDLYQGGPYVPFYLVTQEFFGLVRGHLSEHGLLMLNVFDASQNREVLWRTGATLKRVFPSLFVRRLANGNHIVLAFAGQRSLNSIREQLKAVNSTGISAGLIQRAMTGLVELEPPAGIAAYTDDYSPVEEITRRMLIQSRRYE